MKQKWGIIVLGIVAVGLWFAYNLKTEFQSEFESRFEKARYDNKEKIQKYVDSAYQYSELIDSLQTRIVNLNSQEGLLLDSLNKINESYVKEVDHIVSLPANSQLELFTRNVADR